MEEKKKVMFWKKKEYWGLMALGGLTGLQFPAHTTVFKVGVFLNGIVGIGLMFFGVKDGFKGESLPVGLSKYIHSPNKEDSNFNKVTR